MRVSVIIDPAHDQYDTVRYDIQTFLHFQTRGYWTITEKEDFDGRAVLTIDFSDPSDEHYFKCLSNIARSYFATVTQDHDHTARNGNGIRRSARGHRHPLRNW